MMSSPMLSCDLGCTLLAVPPHVRVALARSSGEADEALLRLDEILPPTSPGPVGSDVAGTDTIASDGITTSSSTRDIPGKSPSDPSPCWWDGRDESSATTPPAPDQSNAASVICDSNSDAEALVDERALTCIADSNLLQAGAVNSLRAGRSDAAERQIGDSPAATAMVDDANRTALPLFWTRWAQACRTEGEQCPCGGDEILKRCERSASCRRRMAILVTAAQR